MKRIDARNRRQAGGSFQLAEWSNRLPLRHAGHARVHLLPPSAGRAVSGRTRTCVRAQVAELCSKIQEMKYTQAVAREVVRYRPPATLVPHMAGEAFKLTEWYTVPKGTLVFPSVYESSFQAGAELATTEREGSMGESSFQGFTSPEEFDPDRFFSEDRREDVVYRRNYLAFGAGGHQCIGQRYALYHLVLFLALFVSVADFERDRTEGCDDLVYMPTIVPRDGCTVFLNQRCATFPSF
ncbi:hypothetical protein QYE76_051195 [Lolium multiflorum]|uniref:sterol 22-desaturase n=1 Tax=Lolium multiflorum TaxID=4521 RepID=A0AAD8ST05_LOLMU|nr:hypothetical protein QYE76_051195 [Lolium multiflorum]